MVPCSKRWTMSCIALLYAYVCYTQDYFLAIYCSQLVSSDLLSQVQPKRKQIHLDHAHHFTAVPVHNTRQSLPQISRSSRRRRNFFPKAATAKALGLIDACLSYYYDSCCGEHDVRSSIWQRKGSSSLCSVGWLPVWSLVNPFIL